MCEGSRGLTNAFSKKSEFESGLGVVFRVLQFCRIHSSIRLHARDGIRIDGPCWDVGRVAYKCERWWPGFSLETVDSGAAKADI